MKTFRSILIGLVIASAVRVGAEPIGDIISYQGKLTNADGAPVANGTQSVTFKIYENGTPVFTQTSSVATLGGVFSAFLGVGALNLDPAKQYEMGVTYAGKETKHQIASVPMAKSVAANGVSTSSIQDGAVTQDKAPFALAGRDPRSFIQSGVWIGDTDATGACVIPYPKPFNGISFAIAMNGHYDATGSVVINGNGLGFYDGLHLKTNRPNLHLEIWRMAIGWKQVEDAGRGAWQGAATAELGYRRNRGAGGAEITG